MKKPAFQTSLLAFALTAAVAAPVAAELDQTTAAALDAAIASDQRSDADKARDRNRRPKQTLEFFGFDDNQKVVEMFPGGGGWYTKILAPVLADKGELIVVGGIGKAYGFGADLARVGELDGKDKIKMVDISADLTVAPSRNLDVKPTSFDARNADLVLTFRNLHNFTPEGRMELYKASYKALKKGGKFGAIDHTQRHMMPDNDETGRRLDPVLVIQEAQAAGFTFVGYSPLHYRPDDELRYEVGRKTVTGNTDRWTLVFEK
ncbi:MAG: methyltransferase [Pseudomonadota bacterium]